MLAVVPWQRFFDRLSFGHNHFAMIQFSMFGIPIRVLPWFWVTMALVGGALHIDSKQEIFRLLLFLIAGFTSILVHELGHALTAKSFGKRVEIVLQAFGGYAAYSGGSALNNARILAIIAAGPGLQILLGGVAFLVLEFAPFANPEGFYFVKTLFLVSMIWAILNLLPVLPMDGGRILQTLLGPSRIKLTLIISLCVATGAAISYFLLTKDVLFSLFMAMFAYESYKALKIVS